MYLFPQSVKHIITFAAALLVLTPFVRNQIAPDARSTANPRSDHLEFQGFDSVRFKIVKGWNSQVHGAFPRRSDSEILSFADSNLETSGLEQSRFVSLRGGILPGQGEALAFLDLGILTRVLA